MEIKDKLITLESLKVAYDANREAIDTLTKELENDFSQLSEEMANLTGGSGLGSTEKALMLTLFKNMLSQSDMSDTVSELETIWTSEDSGGSGDSGSGDYSKTYTIKYNLTNVSSSNSSTSITGGSSFTATLTADSDYTLSTVTVTMGGIDVTDSVYADGVVTIASVTGNVSITATASSSGTTPTWEDGVAYELEVIENEYIKDTDGSIVSYAGWSRTDYANCYGASKLEIRGMTYASPYNAFYDIDKKFISEFGYTGGVQMVEIEVPSNAVYFIISSTTESVQSTVITPRA